MFDVFDWVQEHTLDGTPVYCGRHTHTYSTNPLTSMFLGVGRKLKQGEHLCELHTDIKPEFGLNPGIAEHTCCVRDCF